MFQQLLTPVGDSLGLSFLVAILPIVAVLVLLGVLAPAGLAGRPGRPHRRPRRRGRVWQMPVGLALNSVAATAPSSRSGR